jgi:hypothetical protein
MILGLSLLACVSDPRGGTAVGNPTGLTVDTAPVTSFKLDSGSAVIEEVRSRPCDGTEQSTPVGHAVDLYGSTVVLVGTDRSCVLTITFAGPLVYVGQHQGHEVRLEVPLAEVAFRSPPGGIPGGSRVLVQLGSVDWVMASQLAHDGLADGQAQVVADALRAGSLLYTDVDGDFAIGPAELEAGPVAEALPLTPGAHADAGAGTTLAWRTGPGAGTTERLHEDGTPADGGATADDDESTDDASTEPDEAVGTADHGSAEERASAPDEPAADGGETSTDSTEGAVAGTDASGTSADSTTRPEEDSAAPDDGASDTSATDTRAAEPESATSTDPDDAGEPDAGEPSSSETTDEPDAGEPGADDPSSTEHEDPEEDDDSEVDDTDDDAEADDDHHGESGRHAGRGRNPLPGEPRGHWRDRSAE